jgi:hypothetical protein
MKQKVNLGLWITRPFLKRCEVVYGTALKASSYAKYEIWVENRGGNKAVFCEVSDGKSRYPSAYVIDPAL